MQIQYIRTFLKRVDIILLLSTLLLLAAGLISIYSATHDTAMFIKFQKQVFWTVLGILFIILIYLAPVRFFHYTAFIVYGISLLLLVLVLVTGATIAGSTGWFGIGNFGIQPSEFAKLATVLALARFLSDRATKLDSFRDIFVAFLIVFVPWLLIFLQPDFGTGVVYLGLFLPLIFWAGAEFIILFTMASPVLIAVLSIMDIWIFLAATIVVSVIFYVFKRKLGVALLFLVLNLSVGFSVQYTYEQLPDYQKARIAVYLDPSKAPQSSGYNVIQSKVAIGSGGLSGKGFLQGSQTQLRFVPELWTDFIFCVPAEEFGFFGSVFILILYTIIIIRGLRIARLSQFRFSGLVAVGITSMYAIHTFINIGMTTGIVPVIGIPLPFMSYGGSFFLTSMMGIGLLNHSYANRDRIH